MPTVAPLDLEGHVLGAHFLGDIPVFASAAGNVHRLDMGHKVTEANDGARRLYASLGMAIVGQYHYRQS